MLIEELERVTGENLKLRRQQVLYCCASLSAMFILFFPLQLCILCPKFLVIEKVWTNLVRIEAPNSSQVARNFSYEARHKNFWPHVTEFSFSCDFFKSLCRRVAHLADGLFHDLCPYSLVKHLFGGISFD